MVNETSSKQCMYVLNNLQPRSEVVYDYVWTKQHAVAPSERVGGRGTGRCKLAHDWLAGWNKQAARCSTLQGLKVFCSIGGRWSDDNCWIEGLHSWGVDKHEDKCYYDDTHTTLINFIWMRVGTHLRPYTVQTLARTFNYYTTRIYINLTSH